MNQNRLRYILGFIVALIPLTCSQNNDTCTGAACDTPTDADSDADTDTDTDSDADADTDADSDADTDTDIDTDTDTDTTSSTGYAVAFADMIIDTWPNPLYVTDRPGAWDYNNGIVLRGIAEVFEKTGDARYAAYVKQYVDAFVTTDGTLFVDMSHAVSIENATHNLDTIQPSILLPFLSDVYPEETQYATAATHVFNLYEDIPTNTQGGYWHKNKYPNEMWLDGLYMAQPFLARYGAANSACGDVCYDTTVFQMSLLADHVRLPSGLFLHGWDEDMNASWCASECSTTGLSPEVWSRATGWFAMALVDTLRYMPSDNAGYETLTNLLQELAAGVVANQDPDTGLWCQVVDQCDNADNWLESSGSAMLIYALKEGADMGILPSDYLDAATNAWNGLIAQMITEENGTPVINAAAQGMSIQQNYNAYVGIPQLSNSAHGLCAVLLAAAAMEY